MGIAEKDIKVSLEQAISFLSAGVYWLNIEMKFLGCNAQQARFLGFSSVKEIVGKNLLDFQTKENTAHIQAIYDNNEQVTKSQKAMVFEEELFFSDGSRRVFLSEKSPIFDGEGSVIGLLNVSFDITARKEAEEKIQLAKEEAEAAYASKVDFIRNMGHDIRTPVSGLFGVANILMKQEVDPGKKEILEIIAMASKEILDYANGILAFCKVESESMPVFEKKFVLKKVIDSVVNLEAVIAVQKRLDFRVDFPKNLPPVLIGDAHRLKRILINLVSNALKFTHQGFVRFSVVLASQQDRDVILQFTVADSGIGIPKEKQAYLYEKFMRGVPADQGAYKGVGLGLRIVKQFVREMEGEIELKSSAGKGTTFICTFPFKVPLVSDILEDELEDEGMLQEGHYSY